MWHKKLQAEVLFLRFVPSLDKFLLKFFRFGLFVFGKEAAPKTIEKKRTGHAIEDKATQVRVLTHGEHGVATGRFVVDQRYSTGDKHADKKQKEDHREDGFQLLFA